MADINIQPHQLNSDGTYDDVYYKTKAELVIYDNTNTVLTDTNINDAVDSLYKLTVNHYASCNTAAGTVAKVAALNGFVCTTGVVVAIKFAYANTAINPMLNVNSTGAAYIYDMVSNTYIAAGRLGAGTHYFIFNGAQWVLLNPKSIVGSYTLLATSWTGTAPPYSYTLSVAGVTDTSVNELLPEANVSADQLEALQTANIQDGGQAVNSITLLAYGEKPTADLLIRIIVRGDM